MDINNNTSPTGYGWQWIRKGHKMKTRYPGYRTMTGAQRRNARMEEIFAKAKISTNNWGDGIVPKLDLYETQVYNDLTSKGIEPDRVLKVLINSVEGDFSQLSTGLREYAHSIGEMGE